MDSLQDIKNELKTFYINKQLSAKKIAERNFEYARKDAKFNDNYLKINELNYLLAKKNYDKMDNLAELQKLEKLKKTQKTLLKKINLTPEDLEPKYQCTKCNDSGFVNGLPCACYNTELTKRLLKSNGINYTSLKTFADFNESVATDKKQQTELKKTKEICTFFVDKFYETKYDNIFISGSAGTGKTFFSECIASSLIKKFIYVNMVSAFQMNTIFLNYHGSFDRDKSNILSALLDPDLLIIDDLGTEPVFKNVTREYLGVIINERTLHNKKTIITSNLTARDLLDRYGERIYSRVFSKFNSLQITLKGNDLRSKLKQPLN